MPHHQLCGSYSSQWAAALTCAICAASDASLVENILFSLGANGKCRNTFWGIFFLSVSFHLERPQT
jgi:hypothetical protein